MAYILAANVMRGEDNNSEVMHETLLTLSSSDLGNKLALAKELEDKIVSNSWKTRHRML